MPQKHWVLTLFSSDPFMGELLTQLDAGVQKTSRSGILWT